MQYSWVLQDKWYVPDPNKVTDFRETAKSLLKEFEESPVQAEKLKVFRLEAVRTGFKI